MLHTIENDRLKISVTHQGAELASLIDKESGRELMWQADPAVWGSHAPVLFPIIGTLRGGTTRIKGQEYSIPKHGFVRHNADLEMYGQLEDRLALRLCSSEKTRALYPYDFEFRITYRLRNEHVIVYHEITNAGDEPMPFNLGGHPAFRVPVFDNDRYEDYFLRFEHAENSPSHTVTADGTIGPDTRPVPWKAGNILPLTHELFANDALVFKHLNSPGVVLESQINGPVLKVDFAGWTHLGIWAKPTGDFVCIEPWLGLSDPHDASGEFADKEGLVTLGPRETFERSYDIKVL